MIRISALFVLGAGVALLSACTPNGSADDLGITLESYQVYRIDGAVVDSDSCTACPLFPGEELEFLVRWSNDSGGWVTADLPSCPEVDPLSGGSVLVDSTGNDVPVTCEDASFEAVEFSPASGFYGGEYVSQEHVAKLYVSKSDILSGVVPLPFGEALTFRYGGASRFFNIVDADFDQP